MSSKNSAQKKSKKTLIQLGYILAIIAIALLVVFLDKHQKNRQNQIETSINEAQAKLIELGASMPIPGQPTKTEKHVYNWQGEVTKVEDTKIVFRSPYENSLTKGDDYMDITVYLKPETKFFQLDLSKPLAQNEIIYSRTTQIEKSKIHAGKKIIAQSEKDLNLNLEMEATAIYLIET